MTEARLDVALVARGLARSRTAAARAVVDGAVRVDGAVVVRPSTKVADGALLELEPARHVSRAGAKLEAALDAFQVDPAGRFALDVGASTGGFTAVLLDRGARRVVALDVGHDQLVPELRGDARVVVVERENARGLTAERLAELARDAEPPSLVVADLSFISLVHVLPAVAAVVAPGGDVVCLVKPQYEVGRERVRGGLVPDPGDRAEAVGGVLAAAWALGLGTAGVIGSPVVGTHGNREALVHLRPALGSDPGGWDERVRDATAGVEGGTRGR
ncbi:MAG TPA: TlyA family RNA methyltransferase [Amnibacterium sp.]|nr:TlyA family RNA methyltransferase [Amnibacterium sp.]